MEYFNTYQCFGLLLPCIFNDLVLDILRYLLRQSFLLSSALIGQGLPAIDSVNLQQDTRVSSFKAKIIFNSTVAL